MIIGTAGHVDHGKTSVVRALTGVDTDRLKEEKARGISIELGYAYVPREHGEALGFVDVPGHERLVHTMIAGARAIDFVLLVVAADDGIMPQTREHVAILELLGVCHGAVALTKMDCVDDARLRRVQADIEALLCTTPLCGARRFALNAIRPDDPGTAALREYLEQVATQWPRRSDRGLFRMCVDRVFTLPGLGTVAAGTVVAGRVSVGEIVHVMPQGAAVRVRSLHAQNRAASTGHAGQRVALNIAGIDKASIVRGDWLADARALAPTTRIDAHVRWLEAGMRMAERMPLHVHLGSTRRIARLVPLSEAGAGALRAQLVFEAPLCAGVGDPLVIRDSQARRTLGGGVVIDPYAPARRRRTAERLAYLDALQRLSRGEGLAALLECAPSGVRIADLVRLTGVAAEHMPWPPDVRRIGQAAGAFVILAAHWRLLQERTLGVLQEYHARRPDEPGVDQGRLRRMAMPNLNPAVWQVMLAELLAGNRIERCEYWLRLPEHRVSLSVAEEALAGELSHALAAGGFNPPWVRDLAARFGIAADEVRGLLKKCAARGVLEQVVPDLFYHRDNLRVLALQIRRLAQRSGSLQSTEFRDAVGLGRKRAIQVLEFFDRVGYTRRTPRGRVLRADSSWHDVTTE